MKIKNITEVVIAVKNNQEAVNFFEKVLGMKFDLEWSMPNEKMNVKSTQINNTQLQVVESTADNGVIAKFINSRGEGLHHIAFEVDNIEEWIVKLKEQGVQLVPNEPISYPKGKYIFIHPKSAFGVLIELIEYTS
ncbi:MAG: VOC family protein [candidate division WOR-3 bacterium]